MIARISKVRKDGKVLVTHIFPISGGRSTRTLMDPEAARQEWFAQQEQKRGDK